MLSDREAWLARTSEQALEPDLPICDPHHHLWDYPGSRYLVDDLLRDLSGGHRVVRTVFVECQQFYDAQVTDELKPVGETRFVDAVAGSHPTPLGPVDVAAGIVSYADLTLGAAVEPVLEAHCAASRRFRGVRHASAWDASERIHNAHTHPAPHLLANSRFREGAACLERMGLVFDAWLYHPQLAELTDFAQAFPGLTIVLDHAAGPLGIGPYDGQLDEVFTAWRADLTNLARCENVFIKLGGRTMTSAGFGWHRRELPPGSDELASAIAPYFETCIELFGANRCMFESNFPVDRISCSYTVLWNAFKRLTRRYSELERAYLFNKAAMCAYRLGAGP
jgi:predicted TIM-barrel fold metal-dependent hydrolase